FIGELLRVQSGHDAEKLGRLCNRYSSGNATWILVRDSGDVSRHHRKLFRALYEVETDCCGAHRRSIARLPNWCSADLPISMPEKCVRRARARSTWTKDALRTPQIGNGSG